MEPDSDLAPAFATAGNESALLDGIKGVKPSVQTQACRFLHEQLVTIAELAILLGGLVRLSQYK